MAIPEPAASPKTQLTVAAVARRIGVAPATLRTWDRRYGLGPSEHQEGEHRRYSEEDLARLVHMRKLIVAGCSPADAAERAQAFNGSTSLAPEQILGQENSSDLVEQLFRAANALDRELLEAGLRNHLYSHSVEQTWQNVMCPLLVRVGEQWKKSGNGIEVEHLLSDVILGVLVSRMAQHTNDPEKRAAINPRPVLIASIGEDLHTLAITALAAALSDRNIASQFLGGRTPQGALNEVVRKSSPPAIFMWAQLKRHADPSFISELPVQRPKPQVIVGGPGWKGVDIGKTEVAPDLATACTLIERALGI